MCETLAPVADDPSPKSQVKVRPLPVEHDPVKAIEVFTVPDVAPPMLQPPGGELGGVPAVVNELRKEVGLVFPTLSFTALPPVGTYTSYVVPGSSGWLGKKFTIPVCTL